LSARDPRFSWEGPESQPQDEHEAEVIDLDPARHHIEPEKVEPGEVEPEDEDDRPVLVDSPEAQRPERLDARTIAHIQRRPVLPAWLRSAEELRFTLTWATRYAAHVAAFHAIRVPTVYAGRLMLRSPLGAGRVLSGVVRWVTDWEGRPVRLASVEQIDSAAYLRLSKQRNERVRARGWTLLVLVVLAAIPVVTLGLFAGPVTRGLSLATLLLILGALGRQPDKPLLDTAVVKPKVGRLTSEIVRRALASLSIGALSERNVGQITFPAPITRDGPGWRADVDLPHGVTADEVIEKRDKLASGLRRPIGCVWPEVNHDQHAGRLVLWVGDQDLSQAKQPAWPLLKHGTVDLFKPFPFGTDARGRMVTLTLMFASMVIGSIPRMGKTASLRLIMLAAALDPTVELHLYDLKGTGDFGPLEPVAYRYRAGDDEDDLEYAVADMRELQAELRRRTKVIRELPPALCPESKITPKLAGMKAYRLHPIVVAVDECQRWYEHPKYGADFETISDDLVRRGPAVGIIIIPATQRPDAKSLPKGISANAVLRFCLKVMSHVENDMVLGGSAHKNGVKATMFTRRDLGIGYLAGEGDEPVITRTYYVDRPAADRVVIRARAAREAAGTLGGHAVGQEPASPRQHETLMEDALAVLPATEDRVANEELRDRLAQYRPDTYGDWSTERLTAALRDAGIDPREAQVNRTGDGGERRNRRGVYRQSLMDALTLRGRKGGAE
jgi:S-DNA-T family DNA segregation ATPase FtsK/SpoIIIE